MKTLFLSAAVAAILACGQAGAATGPQLAPWGFDLAGRDTAVAPGTDFFQYANGDYVKALVIPPDRSRYGAFDALAALSEQRVHDILEAAAADPRASGDEARIGAFYKAFMDEARVEALDAAPLAADLAAIRDARDKTALAALMGKNNDGYFGATFGVGIQADLKSPTRYAVYIGQQGLGMPDRDYYLEPSFAAQKAKYLDYVTQTLASVKWPDAEAQAKAIVAMETEVARDSWSKVEDRDPVKTYNPMTPAELVAHAPGFPWAAYLDGAHLGQVGRVVVVENTAFPKIAAVFAATPLETLKAWEAFTVVDNASPYLSKRFADANFEFHGKVLSGQPQQKPRWKRAAAALDADVGEAVGQAYVAKYFPPSSKAAMEALIGQLQVALAARIQNVSWMSAPTKAKALEKLSMLTVKVGYPTKWRDYSRLAISPDDLYGDVARSQSFEWARQVNRLNDTVDRTEWGMTPQTVNAYYNPSQNEIVFPAAILQPPFFDPNADMAVNFGGIGGVIGHEMTHGFDDQGRQFDGTGALSDWWAPEDVTKFKAQTTRLSAQYSAFEPVKGGHVNGDLTMGENIADLGGLLLGLDAYHLSLHGAAAPVRDGLTGDQRVFMGWAQVWRAAIRDDDQRRRLVIDPHSPAKFRVDGVVRNIDAWYTAFGVKPGDALFVAPDQRVRIW
ncbi:MAG TPA: M13-type metalloendopeptidase [Caulobacteraceae bacterium]